jgi:hypothetical protein
VYPVCQWPKNSYVSFLLLYVQEIKCVFFSRTSIRIIYSNTRIWRTGRHIARDGPNFTLLSTFRFLGSTDTDNFFSRAQRSRIVFEILSTTTFGREKKGEVGHETIIFVKYLTNFWKPERNSLTESWRHKSMGQYKSIIAVISFWNFLIGPLIPVFSSFNFTCRDNLTKTLAR